METEMIVWLILLVVFGAIEAATAQLTCIWFALGALVSLIVSLVGGALWLQVVLFIVVSLAVLIFLRPIVKKVLQPGPTATNADRNIGATAVVTEAISNITEKGEVFINGLRWSARSEHGEDIPSGVPVKILRIDGVKLFVEPIDSEEKED